MTTFSFYNPSSRRQRRWVQVPMSPAADSQMPHDICTVGAGFLIVRGETVGDHTHLWHCYADLPPGEHAVNMDTVQPLRGVDWPAFQWSQWITDDLKNVAPSILIRDGEAQIEVSLSVVGIERVGDTLSRFHLRGVNPAGWVAELWAKVWTFQDVIDIEGHVTWSDRTTPEVRKESVVVGIESAENLVVDYISKLPSKIVTLHDGPVIDATSIPFQGALLCGPLSPGELSPSDEQRIDQLAAASEGAIYACTSSFARNQEWLAFGYVTDESFNPWSYDGGEFKAWLDQRALSVYDRRPLANDLRTAATGSQAPFGATKHIPALFRAPALYELLWSSQDYLCRGLHNYNEDGSELWAHEHPEWETWDGVSERNSRDKLGKTGDRPWGWDRMPNGRNILVDDQHRGDAYIICAYALTGSPLLLRGLRNQLQVDFARAKRKRKQINAPRASGRLWQSWAKLTMLMPEARETLKTLATDELELWEDLMANHRPGEVRWLDHVRDARVLGSATTAAVPWNEALCVMGAYEQYFAWEHLDEDLAGRFLQFATTQSNTILKWGTVRDSAGNLYPLTGVEVNEINGDPMPEVYYTFPRVGASFAPGPGIDMLVGSMGWWDWFSGVIHCAARFSNDSDAKSLANEVGNRHYGEGRGLQSLEWTALP